MRPVTAERVVHCHSAARVGSVDHFAVPSVHPNVTHTPAVRAKEEKVAGLNIVPRHLASAVILLRGRARQTNALSPAIKVFGKAGAVEAVASVAAIAITSPAERQSAAHNA